MKRVSVISLFIWTLVELSGVILGLRLPRSVKYPTSTESSLLHINNIQFSSHHRHLRSSSHQEFPSSFTVEFSIQGAPAYFNLTKHHGRQEYIPSFTIQNGKTVKHIQSLKKVPSGFYHDIENGASFHVTCKTSQSAKCIELHLYGYIIRSQAVWVIESSDDSADSKVTISKATEASYIQTDFIQSDQPKLRKKEARRSKRATGNYKVELLIVLDYSVYNSWYQSYNQNRTSAIDGLKQYYAFLLNGMQVRYRSLTSAQYTIEIELVGLVIIEQASQAPFTENIKDNSDRVDAEMMLQSFKTWVNDKLSSGSVPNHDHAMAFTQYDLMRAVDTSTTGYAYLSQMCTDKSQSVVEDQFNFISHTVAAHEMGHSLGARHDGQENSCSESSHFIMAAASTAVNANIQPNYVLNPWKFSSCSLQEMNSLLNSLDVGGGTPNCLQQEDETPYDIKDYLSPAIGQTYDINQQCRYAVGSGSYACLSNYNGDYGDICTGLSCLDPENSSNCLLTLPGDGTTCGNNKWCRSGRCVFNSSAPGADESCLYGDSLQPVLSSSCDVTIPSNPHLCYQQFYINTCCHSCQHEETGVQGCEYGDRLLACNITHGSACYNNNQQTDCCQSCRSFLTSDPDCRYGDRAPNCDAIITSGVNCYGQATNGQQLNNACCQKCKQFETNIQNCQYGDRRSDCLSNDCRFYNADLLNECCETCAAFIGAQTSSPDPGATTPGSSSSLPQWVIPVAAGGGGLLLLIILIAIGCCACRRGNNDIDKDARKAEYQRQKKMALQSKYAVQGQANPAYYSSQGYIDPGRVSGPTVKDQRARTQLPAPPKSTHGNGPALSRTAQQSVRSEHVYMELDDPYYQKLQRDRKYSGQYSQPYDDVNKYK